MINAQVNAVGSSPTSFDAEPWFDYAYERLAAAWPRITYDEWTNIRHFSKECLWWTIENHPTHGLINFKRARNIYHEPWVYVCTREVERWFTKKVARTAVSKLMGGEQ